MLSKKLQKAIEKQLEHDFKADKDVLKVFITKCPKGSLKTCLMACEQVYCGVKILLNWDYNYNTINARYCEV